MATDLVMALLRVCAAVALVAAGCAQGVRTEAVGFKSGAVRLAGTLYLPHSQAPAPAVVLLHGSGPDGRANNYYRYLAQRLVRRGVAALVYDKRGCGESEGDWRISEFTALADDACAAAVYLRSRSDINPNNIGFWGGSEGASVAALAVANAPELASWVIMQSGTGVTFAEQNLYQTQRQAETAYTETELVNQRMKIQRLMHAYARTGIGWDEYAAAVSGIRNPDLASEIGAPLAADNWWWSWYRTKMDVDTAHVLAGLQVPVLCIWGGRDNLVPIDASEAAIKRAAKTSGKSDIDYIHFPQADHSLLINSGLESLPHIDEMLAWIEDTSQR